MHHSANNSKGKRIFYAIADARTSVISLEAMGMVPQLIRPFQLQIFKSVRWLPRREFGSPTHGNPVPMQQVVNQCAGEQLDRLGREDLKAQPFRSEQLEIAGVGEKAKNFANAWEPIVRGLKHRVMS